MDAVARSRTRDHQRPGVAPTAVALHRARARLHWSPARIEEHQLRALQETVDHANASVPFYRKRVPGGLRLTSMRDLATLPLTDRSDVGAVPVDDRRGTPVTPRTAVRLTSGSTGEYLQVELSARAAWWQGILALRRNRERGIRPWERTVALRIGLDRRPRQGLLGALARRAVVLDASEDPRALAKELLELDPVALAGFGHLLIDVAAELPRPLRPRVLGTGGQTLAPSDRQQLVDAFGVAPLDLYGAVEVGSIAWQCAAADLYHVDFDSVVLEVVDDEGRPLPEGEVGEAVVTTLQNPHMPVLRYRLGDRVRMATRPCRCGLVGPAVASLDGRTMDWFRHSDESAVAPARLFLSAHLRDAPLQVRRYRVIQRPSGRVIVEVVPRGSHLTPAVRAQIECSFQRVLGSAVPVDVELVPHLALDPSGKFRQFVVQRASAESGSRR